MASSVTLVFSEVVDPKNPLYLGNDCSESIDWEFRIIPQPRKLSGAPQVIAPCHRDVDSLLLKKDDCWTAEKSGKDSKAMVSCEDLHEEDDAESEASEALDDSSLQPYDLSDDDTDLKKKFSQLANLSIDLRKPDDLDGMERALDAANGHCTI